MSTQAALAVLAPVLLGTLLTSAARPEAANRPSTLADCGAARPAVPPEYLDYHALVSPHATLGTGRGQAPCGLTPPRVRT